MLRSGLCDYSDAYILVKGNISVKNIAAAGVDTNNTNKKEIFKNCAAFTDCIIKINNTEVDNAKDIDIVMPMYNLIEYSDNSGGFLGRLLGRPLIKNVIKPLPKNVLIPLGLTAAASAADAGIHKKTLWSGRSSSSALHKTLIISNDEMEDIIKIIKSLEDSGLLLKGVSETVQNEAREQKKKEFASMLLGTLGANLLQNILAGKGAITKCVSEKT